MTATLVVAILALLLSAGSLGWQVYSHLATSRTRIEVACAGTWPFDGPLRDEDYALTVMLVNHSLHDLPMPFLHVTQPSTGIMWPIFESDPLAEVPDTFRARGDQNVTVPMARFVSIDLEQPVVAEAILATGETFRSPPTVIAHVRT